MAFTWYDAYGRPVDMKVLKVEQAAPTSAGVRRPDALHPAAGLTPGALAGILRDAIEANPERYLALAEDMEERDLHYAGVLGVRKRQVAGLEITVEAGGDDAKSVEAADLVRSIIEREGFEDELTDILDAVGKGFSCTEILWDMSESQWMPRRLAWRDPRWFTFDRIDGETPYLRDVSGDQPLAPYKWIFHSAKVKSGLPVRGGIARAVAWNFMFKSYTVKDWAIFCEAYGQPLRLGKFDPGASEKDKETLLEAVTNIGTDYAAIIPLAMQIEFVKADISGSHELYEKRADWLDRQTSKVVLGQTATTDAIAGGHAVGKTHDGVREDIERADAKQLAASLNRDLVRPLIDLNLGAPKKYPKICIGRAEETDVDKLVKNVTMLVPYGLRVGVSTMRDHLGLPDPGPDEEVLVAPRAPAPASATEEEEPLKPGDKPEQTAASADLRGGKRDAIDDATDDMMADWQPLVAPIVSGLADQIAEAGSIEEVQRLLAERFRGLDVNAMTEQLARAAFGARLAGEVDDKLSDAG